MTLSTQKKDQLIKQTENNELSDKSNFESFQN
jgi:hypothetical protein